MKVSKLIYKRYHDNSAEWVMVFEGIEKTLILKAKQAKEIIKLFKLAKTEHNLKTDNLIYIEYHPVIF